MQDPYRENVLRYLKVATAPTARPSRHAQAHRHPRCPKSPFYHMESLLRRGIKSRPSVSLWTSYPCPILIMCILSVILCLILLSRLLCPILSVASAISMTVPPKFPAPPATHYHTFLYYDSDFPLNAPYMQVTLVQAALPVHMDCHRPVRMDPELPALISAKSFIMGAFQR